MNSDNMEENKIQIEENSDMMNYLKNETKANEELLNHEDNLIDTTNLESIRDNMQIPDEIDESQVSRPEASELRENLNFTFDPKDFNFTFPKQKRTNVFQSEHKQKKAKKKKNRIANKSKRNNR